MRLASNEASRRYQHAICLVPVDRHNEPCRIVIVLTHHCQRTAEESIGDDDLPSSIIEDNQSSGHGLICEDIFFGVNVAQLLHMTSLAKNVSACGSAQEWLLMLIVDAPE